MVSSFLAIAALLLPAVTFTHALSSDGISYKKPYSVVFDDSPGLGRVFEGIGAISGGGATSKLLVNYPKKQQKEILDYLFKPNFGASLQIFKVEIGGDAQSTDGTEASHMHNSWDENYSRGYEWWLMQEAKKRNPDIKLYGLPWTYPGWLGDGKHDPYVNPKRTADYVVRWINAAKTEYNLDIDYIGIWNERHYNITYIKTLRQTLDERGFSKTLIIASDAMSWEIAKDIENDTDLASAVYAIGAHYPRMQSSQDAVQTQKPLWASEDYNTANDEVGGGCWARTLNQNYVNASMTSTIAWNMIFSYYPHLEYFRSGLMSASQPWSGHYNVSTPIWMTAHTTQFAPVGWSYLRHDSGVGKLPKGGSYVSLTNKAKDQLTIVIETMTHNHSVCWQKIHSYNVSKQNVTITLKGSFAKIEKMKVWYSKLTFDGSDHTMFQKEKPLKFVNGKAKLNLGLDEIYTLTTLKKGKKGSHPKPPKPSPFPLWISDSFDDYDEYQEPFYLVPQMGSIEVRKIDGENVVRQTTLERPIYWCKAELANKTMSVIGDYDWSEMSVSVAYKIPETNGTDGVFVAARVDHGGCDSRKAKGVFFFVFPITRKYIVSNDLARKKVLARGSVPSTSEWHRITLEISAGKATGMFDRTTAFTIDLPEAPVSGWAAIGTDNYGLADFDDLELKGPQST